MFIFSCRWYIVTNMCCCWGFVSIIHRKQVKISCSSEFYLSFSLVVDPAVRAALLVGCSVATGHLFFQQPRPQLWWNQFYGGQSLQLQTRNVFVRSFDFWVVCQWPLRFSSIWGLQQTLEPTYLPCLINWHPAGTLCPSWERRLVEGECRWLSFLAGARRHSAFRRRFMQTQCPTKIFAYLVSNNSAKPTGSPHPLPNKI